MPITEQLLIALPPSPGKGFLLCLTAVFWNCRFIFRPCRLSPLTGSLKCAFLDSSLSNNLGRYSIIGIQPYLKLVKNADGFFVNDQPETELSFEDYLRRYLAEHVDQNDTDLPLVSGAIGYFSYDYGRKLQGVPSARLLMPKFRTPC